jgi:endonuclease/exonuclease/phosphatase family metal-dependent hydrolase
VAGQVVFTAVSLYGQWEMIGGDDNYFACSRVHRILSDLTGPLSRSRQEPLLIAGDFNLTTQLDADGRGYDAADRAQAAFARLSAWGMVDAIAHTHSTRAALPDCGCGRLEGCAHLQTYRHLLNSDSHPVQLDYAFISGGLIPALCACRVVDDGAAWELSDHCPILLDLDI